MSIGRARDVVTWGVASLGVAVDAVVPGLRSLPRTPCRHVGTLDSMVSDAERRHMYLKGWNDAMRSYNEALASQAGDEMFAAAIRRLRDELADQAVRTPENVEEPT